MTRPPTVAEFQRLIGDLDRHMGELQNLIAQGRAIRETLVKGMAAAAWAEAGDENVIRIDRGEH